MHFVIIVLALIGAGIYTENSGFYWAAGAVGGFAALISLFVLTFVNKVRRDVNTLQDDVFTRFGKKF